MANLADELDKQIDAAAAGERAKEAKAALAKTEAALTDGTVTKEQLQAAITAFEAVGDYTGSAIYKVALARLTSRGRP